MEYPRWPMFAGPAVVSLTITVSGAIGPHNSELGDVRMLPASNYALVHDFGGGTATVMDLNRAYSGGAIHASRAAPPRSSPHG